MTRCRSWSRVIVCAVHRSQIEVPRLNRESRRSDEWGEPVPDLEELTRAFLSAAAGSECEAQEGQEEEGRGAGAGGAGDLAAAAAHRGRAGVGGGAVGGGGAVHRGAEVGG